VPVLANTDLSRLLGADPVVAAATEAAVAPADSRFQLLGVVAPRMAAVDTRAVALIAVDGKPPRAYRVGAVVEGDTVLRAVHARGADLGARNGPVRIALQLPAQPAAAFVNAAAPAPGAPRLPNFPGAGMAPMNAPPPNAQPAMPQNMTPRQPPPFNPNAAGAPSRVPYGATPMPTPAQVQAPQNPTLEEAQNAAAAQSPQTPGAPEPMVPGRRRLAPDSLR
jgi:general secretion pathway protein C